MPSPSIRHRAVLPVFAALLLFQTGVRGQDLAAPDQWDIGTGEMIPGAVVEKTKDFGAIIADPGGAGGGFWRRAQVSEAAQQLQAGDIILGVDGMRIFGWRDFTLARFRNSLATTMTLLINRKGDLQWVKLHDMTPGRDIGVQFDMDTEADHFLDAAETLGVGVSDATFRSMLRQMPARAAAELQLWATSGNSSDTAWLQDFLDIYHAVVTRDYSKAVKPAHEPPIPYFQRLEKFYLGLAAANQPNEVAPDAAKSGETPEFYALSLPAPFYSPPLGEVKFADRRFQVLFTRVATGDHSDDAEIATAMQKYQSNNAGGLDQYLDQAKAYLLGYPDPGIIYNSPLAQNGLSRQMLIQELGDRMKDPKDPNWTLDAFAMIALKYNAEATDELATLVDQLGQHSTYLAREAVAGLYTIRHARRARWAQLYPTEKVMDANAGFLGSNAPKVYYWALKNVRPTALTVGEADANQLTNPYDLLVWAPYAELAALKGTGPVAKDYGWDQKGLRGMPSAN
jgi:hypothetical protein